jgi:hypothetical protein
MKRKHLLLIVGTTAAFVGLTLGALAMLPERPGVTKANFDRIKNGMTRVEVEGILGEPSRNPLSLLSGRNIWTHVEWNGVDGARIHFTFLNDVIDINANAGSWTPSSETIGDKFRRRLYSCHPRSQ